MSKNDGIVNLKGKQYYTVSRRVADFRAAHPISDGWGLLTSIAHMDDTTILFRAAVVNASGSEVAVGFAEETRSNRGVNSTSALENAETSAIGRALAAAGYGGDGAYASADELVNALSQQNAPRKTTAHPSRQNTHPSWARDERGFMDALKGLGLTLGGVSDFCADRKWGRPSEWTTEERRAFLDDLEAGKFPSLYKPEAS